MSGYVPVHLPDLVASITYKPGWSFFLAYDVGADDSALALMIVSDTENSLDHAKRIRVRHEFLVPPASYNRDVWVAWIFDRVRDVETHEAGEFFRVNDVREFAPHHGNGEDPYRVWHVSDWATAAKSAGDPPDEPRPLIVNPCPECRQGKHINCTELVMADDDSMVPCPCRSKGHES